MSRVESDDHIKPIDHDALRRVLSEHPIRLAVLFGSHACGNTHSTSDVDLAVEFDRVSEREYTDTYLRLVADVMSALDENSIDVADLERMKPAVGKSALEQGILIVGSPERVDHHLKAFDRAITPPERTRRERFDTVLDQVEELVGDG